MESGLNRNGADRGDAAEAVEKADVAMGAAVTAHRHHPVLKTLGHVGELGDQGPLYVIGTSVVAVGAMRRDARCLLAGLAVLAAVGAADLFKNGVKGAVKRSRPKHSVEEGEYRFEAGGSSRKEEQSFPSGHTACTVAATEAAILFYPATKPYLRPVAAVMTASRLAKGHQWPLDLLAGVVIGKLSQTLATFTLAAFITKAAALAGVIGRKNRASD